MFRDEANLIHAINRGLAKEYDVECRALQCQADVFRADTESTLREGSLSFRAPRVVETGKLTWCTLTWWKGGRGGATQHRNGGRTSHGQGGANAGPDHSSNGNSNNRHGCWGRISGDVIARVLLGWFWPAIFAAHAPAAGFDPAIHPNGLRQRCAIFDQIGHSPGQYPLILTLGCDPIRRPPARLYTA